jgi:anti-sigma B factor antagonist
MLKIDNINNINVASFEYISRFNSLITDAVKEQLNNLFNKPNNKLILNLDGIKFIDSSGFGVLLSVMKTANINSGQFKLCSINKEVLDLFKLLQLQNVFDIYHNLNDCLNSFK